MEYWWKQKSHILNETEILECQCIVNCDQTDVIRRSSGLIVLWSQNGVLYWRYSSHKTNRIWSFRWITSPKASSTLEWGWVTPVEGERAGISWIQRDFTRLQKLGYKPAPSICIFPKKSPPFAKKKLTFFSIWEPFSKVVSENLVVKFCLAANSDSYSWPLLIAQFMQTPRLHLPFLVNQNVPEFRTSSLTKISQNLEHRVLPKYPRI